ncbi:MAG: hypothetical protein IBJ03_00405 [Gemmatimonadaceae bacterium]|nr:hypothetical protein [Gemmatimonadaceae bacterium]
MRQTILLLTAAMTVSACGVADRSAAAAKSQADSIALINARIPELKLLTVPTDSLLKAATCVRDSIPLGVLVECTLPGGSAFTLHQDTIVGIQDGPRVVALDGKSSLEMQWNTTIGLPYFERMGGPSYFSVASDSSSVEAIWDGMDMSRTFVTLTRTPEGGVIRRVVGDCHPQATHRPVKGCDR